MPNATGARLVKRVIKRGEDREHRVWRAQAFSAARYVAWFRR